LGERRMFSKTKRVLITLLLTCAVLASGDALAKVGLQSLSKSEQKEVWTSTRNIARIDAILAACNRKTNIDRRIIAAVSRCVKPKTISALRSYWRKQKAKYAKELPQLDCNNDYMKKEINKAVRQFNQLVSEVSENCRKCFFC
jgi:hypothetical protein